MSSKTTDVSRASTPNRVDDAIRALKALNVTTRYGAVDRLPEVAVISQMSDSELEAILAEFPARAYAGFGVAICDGGEDPSDYTPDPWTELADHLLELAEAVATLAGKGLAAPASVNFQIQPGPFNGSDDEKITAVNAIGQALLGKDGVPRTMCDGTVHHDVTGTFGVITVGAFRGLLRKAEPTEAGETA